MSSFPHIAAFYFVNSWDSFFIIINHFRWNIVYLRKIEQFLFFYSLNMNSNVVGSGYIYLKFIFSGWNSRNLRLYQCTNVLNLFLYFLVSAFLFFKKKSANKYFLQTKSCRIIFKFVFLLSVRNNSISFPFSGIKRHAKIINISTSRSKWIGIEWMVGRWFSMEDLKWKICKLFV